MKKVIFTLAFAIAAFGVSNVQGQTPAPAATPSKTITVAEAQAPAKSKSKPFRPTKDQIKAAQTLLKSKALYAGEATGKYDDETRSGIRSFQKDNKLRSTGTLNRSTLEKMGIELTDAQKAMPADSSQLAESDMAGSGDKPKRPPVFRASADQIKQAQRHLKSKSMYGGDETGKLDDTTREGLKKFQEAAGMKVTGTLNKATLEKMGIALTEKQKEVHK